MSTDNPLTSVLGRVLQNFMCISFLKKQKKEKQSSQMIQSQSFKNYIEKYIIYEKMYMRYLQKSDLFFQKLMVS